MAERFRANPRPDTDVVRVLEQALNAARLGHIRAVTLVVVNPLHEVETQAAGDQTGSLKHALIGGLSSAAHKLLETL